MIRWYVEVDLTFDAFINFLREILKGFLNSCSVQATANAVQNPICVVVRLESEITRWRKCLRRSLLHIVLQQFCDFILVVENYSSDLTIRQGSIHAKVLQRSCGDAQELFNLC